MKAGPVKKEDAHPTENDSMVCGIIKLSKGPLINYVTIKPLLTIF